MEPAWASRSVVRPARERGEAKSGEARLIMAEVRPGSETSRTSFLTRAEAFVS